MINHISAIDPSKNSQLESLYKSIAEGNAILFLGAGASVTEERKFLSKDIIEFFEDKKGISWSIDDITEFVDALSNNSSYSRDEFDDYVDMCLRKLKISVSHKSIAKIPWRLIITTNYDLLIEGAYTEIEGTHEEIGRLKVIHTSDQYHSIQARNEIKYVKLNGCISNKRDYKLVFSTDDFEKSKKFYRGVLNDLKNLSDRIVFLSVGYSYSDAFAKKLLEKIDSFGFRERRIIYNVDPFVNDAALPIYSSKRICVIKATMADFFKGFETWKGDREVGIQAKKNSFTDHKNNNIYIPINVAKRVSENLKQLNSYYRSRYIQESEYYKGEEPDYNVILRNYDVPKTEKLDEVTREIFEVLNNGANTSRIVPLFLLTGTFGTGKSTFAYRLLNKLSQIDTPTAAFEIIDPYELSVVDLKEIFIRSKCNYIFLYIDTIEINSVFKSLLELRNSLSVDGTPECKIVLIATIRQNIYLKFKEEKEIKNSFEINVDCKFNKNEIEEFVDKLKNSGTISYRDTKEKNAIINKISKEYAGDSYISLLELVQGNKLIDDLLQAYHELNEKCRKAFIYTSLIYQYKIPMPAGLLCSLVTTDWVKFRDEVIERDGKGILLQEVVDSKGTEADLYFKTKHPIVSQKLIEALLPNEDERFNYIKSIVTHIISGSQNSKLLINIIKAIIAYKHLPFNKINHLYDLADNHLSEDPYFLLYYAINLQQRQNEADIKKAISKIQYAESISEMPYRNRYLIHRRGVLAFALARLIYSKNKESQFYRVIKYVNEAKDFLEIKRALDPFSSYSYTDLLNLEIWCLQTFQEDVDKNLKRKIAIEELFDIAVKTVFENSNRIFEIKNKYIKAFKFNGDEEKYVDYLQEYFEDSNSRPYALILLFNHYLAKGDDDKCQEYLVELENLTLNSDVLILLLKYYGRNLFDHQVRMKFFDLVKNNPELEEVENLRFNYFFFIAESYNKNFKHAYGFLSNIKKRYNYINPDFSQVWTDYETKETILFEAVLKINRNGRKQFFIPSLNLWVKSENWSREWEVNTYFDVELRFYIYGLRAKAINIISEEDEVSGEGNDITEDYEL